MFENLFVSTDKQQSENIIVSSTQFNKKNFIERLMVYVDESQKSYKEQNTDVHLLDIQRISADCLLATFLFSPFLMEFLYAVNANKNDLMFAFNRGKVSEFYGELQQYNTFMTLQPDLGNGINAKHNIENISRAMAQSFWPSGASRNLNPRDMWIMTITKNESD